ncbi:unnamed protein product [Mytilus edulis]|uniref:C-type lectin domain-containing protein n=1 Tax=Mytilus edulis TaxID=6550 RepID=A0A8S3R6K6_MYTED|nr:unnamed protein product [Mytilus edulis]
MKIQVVAALLCLIVVLYSEGPCKTLPTTCPEGYTKLTNQRISPNCYLFGGSNTENRTDWHVANAICTSTPGAYLWIPETEEEAKAVLVKFDAFGKLQGFDIFTGANNLADRNRYVYAGTNGIFDPNNLPFGIPTGGNPISKSKYCVELEWNMENRVFEWDADPCSGSSNEGYVCEFPIILSSTSTLGVNCVPISGSTSQDIFTDGGAIKQSPNSSVGAVETKIVYNNNKIQTYVYKCRGIKYTVGKK